jgi:spore coat polysaccharide biosynthesis predicted glycosyltransferase SpsG
MLIIITAENQRGVGVGMHERGSAVCLGWWEQVGEQDIAASLGSLLEDADLRARMAESGRRLVDGRGAERVQAVMKEDLRGCGPHR